MRLIDNVTPCPIDLNPHSIDIAIGRLVVEQSYEIIDCNGSQLVADEAVSVGKAQERFGRGPIMDP
ncbi:MAG: hypothetical protein ACR2RV_24410 [Verrucomicrobiales bacterium]